MAEAYIVAAARTAGGRKGGRLAGWHPADLAASVLDSLVDRTRRRSRPDRRRDHGLRDAGRRAVQQRRAQRRDGLEAAGERARHLDRPPVRLVAAGAAFRGAGRDVRHDGHRDRRRRGIDDAGADGPGLAAAGQERLWPLQEPGHREAISEHRVQPVHRRGNDGGEIRPLQGTSSTNIPTRATSARSPRPRPASSRTRSFRCRSPAPTARPTPTTSTKASASTPASTASRASS